MKVLAAEPKIGMTGREAHDFLNQGKLLLQLGTTDSRGEPNIHTVWYIFDPGAEKLYLATGKGSRKVQNLKRKSKVYFCVDDEKTPQKGVRGKAKARVIEEKTKNLGIVEKILIKYLGTTEGPIAGWLLDHIRAGTDIIVELTPDYLSTWDYAKMKM